MNYYYYDRHWHIVWTQVEIEPTIYVQHLHLYKVKLLTNVKPVSLGPIRRATNIIFGLGL